MMNMPFLFGQASVLPYLLVYLFGLGFAIERRSGNPAMYTSAAIGFGLMACGTILNVVVSYLLMSGMYSHHQHGYSSILLVAQGVMSLLFHGGGWVLILKALFFSKETPQ